MKTFTEQQVDDLIKLKWGKLVVEPGHQAYVSDKVLAKIYRCSQSHIRKQYTARFEKHRLKQQPLLEQMKQE